MHNPLLHGKALLVVATGDTENVAFEFIAHRVAGHFLAHTSVDEDSELAVVFDFDGFLRPIRGKRDV
jgi:hypothetical protein